MLSVRDALLHPRKLTEQSSLITLTSLAKSKNFKITYNMYLNNKLSQHKDNQMNGSYLVQPEGRSDGRHSLLPQSGQKQEQS